MCIRCLVLLRASLIKRAGTILIKEEAALTTRQTHIAHRRAVKVVRGKGFILFLGVWDVPDSVWWNGIVFVFIIPKIFLWIDLKECAVPELEYWCTEHTLSVTYWIRNPSVQNLDFMTLGGICFLILYIFVKIRHVPRRWYPEQTAWTQTVQTGEDGWRLPGAEIKRESHTCLHYQHAVVFLCPAGQEMLLHTH